MKRLLLAPLFLAMLIFNQAFKHQEKLEVLLCRSEGEEEEFKIYSEWDWSVQDPWIISQRTGKIYFYVPYINEIRQLKEVTNGDLKFKYDSKLIGNIIEVKGNWTSNGKPSSTQKFHLNLNEKTETSWILSSGSNTFSNEEINNTKTVNKCKELGLPKGVKIKY